MQEAQEVQPAQYIPTKGSAFVNVVERDANGELQRVLMVLNKTKKVRPKNTDPFVKPMGWSPLGGGIKNQRLLIPNLQKKYLDHCENSRECAVRELFEEGRVVLDTGSNNCNDALLVVAEEIKQKRFLAHANAAFVEIIHEYTNLIEKLKILKPVLVERKLSGHRTFIFEIDAKHVLDSDKLSCEFDFATNTIKVSWFTREMLEQAAEGWAADEPFLIDGWPVYPIVLHRVGVTPYLCECDPQAVDAGITEYNVASVTRFKSPR